MARILTILVLDDNADNADALAEEVGVACHRSQYKCKTNFPAIANIDNPSIS